MNPLTVDRDADGVQVLRSKLLLEAGFPNAFSTIIGPNRALFDLSAPDATRAVAAPAARVLNLERFDRLFPESEGVVTTRQVHGADVVIADDSPAPGDGLIGTRANQAVGVRTADCVPILLADPRSGIVAAVHAGWRGLVTDVVGETIRRLAEFVEAPSRLIAAIGPAIGPRAYEIGPEVAARFAESGLGDALVEEGTRFHADLHLATRNRLSTAGVDPSRIDGDPVCTHDDPRFFSYRRSGLGAGSHLAAIQAGTTIQLMPR